MASIRLEFIVRSRGSMRRRRPNRAIWAGNWARQCWDNMTYIGIEMWDKYGNITAKKKRRYLSLILQIFYLTSVFQSLCVRFKIIKTIEINFIKLYDLVSHYLWKGQSLSSMQTQLDRPILIWSDIKCRAVFLFLGQSAIDWNLVF